jgi:hypothetical protein
MALEDLTVDIVPIVRPITGKRRNRARNLLQQGTDLRGPCCTRRPAPYAYAE